jgi:hypothetical protein
MGKTNHLKPIHTGGTACITTRREPAREQATQTINGRRTGETMAANLELTRTYGSFPVSICGLTCGYMLE